MDVICDFDNCTGCGLCVSLCPKQSISLKPEGSLGHVFPHINTATCIDCGICKKNCPVLHPVELIVPQTAFAAWSKDDDEYRSSTSGGIASELSRYVLSKGGVVYGCAMLSDIDVKHIRIDNISEINKLKGSKYVQSNAVGIYPQVKKDVKDGRLTMVIGTPCQIAAVNGLFRDRPDNLLLVDIICHGVPSVELLRKHVKKIANYSHYDNIIFRDGLIIYFVVVVDGKIVYRQTLKNPRYKDWYINTFIDGYTYRESCYHCRYACRKRISDITIGDFWGLGGKISADYIPEHKHGCSLILPITEKGMQFVERISMNLNIYERKFEEAVDGNEQLRTPFKKGMRIKMFKHLYPRFGNSAYYMVIPDKYVLSRAIQLLKALIDR